VVPGSHQAFSLLSACLYLLLDVPVNACSGLEQLNTASKCVPGLSRWREDALEKADQLCCTWCRVSGLKEARNRIMLVPETPVLLPERVRSEWIPGSGNAGYCPLPFILSRQNWSHQISEYIEAC